MLRSTYLEVKKNNEVILIQVNILLVEGVEGVVMRGQDIGEILWRSQCFIFDLAGFYISVFNC